MLRAFFEFVSKSTTNLTAFCIPILKHGDNQDIDSTVSISAPETIWDNGGEYVPPSSAVTMDIVSADANDTLGGTGANIVLIEGLDADYNIISELVNLNGTSTVTTTLSFLRLNFVRVVYSGSGQINAGNITVSNGGTTYGFITALEGLDHTMHYTVPAGYTLFIVGSRFAVQRAASTVTVEVAAKAMVPVTNTKVVGTLIEVVSTAGPTVLDNNWWKMARVPEKTDTWYSVISCTANNTEVTGSFRGLLIKHLY